MDPITGTVTATLAISDIIGLFQPIVYVTPESVYTGTLPTFGFTGIFTNSAPYGATIYAWMMENVVMDVYISVALGFAALLFVISFVWRRIRAGQQSAQTIVVLGDRYNRRSGR